jgi:hypothetical protein
LASVYNFNILERVFFVFFFPLFLLKMIVFFYEPTQHILDYEELEGKVLSLISEELQFFGGMLSKKELGRLIEYTNLGRKPYIPLNSYISQMMIKNMKIGIKSILF